MVEKLPNDLEGMESSMEKLYILIDEIYKYVDDVVEGRVAPDNRIGRFISDSVASMPKLSPAAFDKHFNDKIRDNLALVYLSSITRTQISIAEKLNTAAQAPGMVDKFRMRAKGGDGGNGCVSLRRSRSNLHGMPDGGNGGKGGDIILECSRSIWDFSGLQHHMSEKLKYFRTSSVPRFSNTDSDVRSYPRQEGIDEKDQTESEDEEFWEDEDEFNIDNEDDKEEEEREEEDVQYCVAEMPKPGQRLIIARGGEGGLGNAFVIKEMRPSKASRQEKIARLSTGQPGTESFLILELKSIADVGLVGFPNAGKSTLWSSLSRAQPEIADYEFTTLRPNIGSLTYEDYYSVKVADIPGLIKGAHENRGLGHAFLRHIGRTKVLAYALDLAATLNGRKGVPPWEQLQDLISELEHYQEGLTRRPSLIVANKIDEEGAEEMYEELKRRVQGVPIFPVCAILQEGVPDLRVGLRNLMDDSDPGGIDLSKTTV
ncbi:unnamed protein product [Miscanthus lutarioriparius]|uniref:Uncharacterized protein n=1 Tax=Miscanthus lutarioriparius TaxID=422564 RepID=A0A811RTU1_9POAL|nr:unnamed protein product [Miscanthus lutarioriparius]